MSKLSIGGVTFITGLILLGCCGCSSGISQGVEQASPAGLQAVVEDPPTTEQSVLGALPADGLQPWETLDAAGHVQSQRTGSTVNADSEFSAGAERFLDGGSVAEAGSALALSSGSFGSAALSHAIYRFALQGDEPGVISADVNLLERSDGQPSTYWLALSDYSRGSWELHGPFSDSHVRVRPGGGSYLSALGNLFVAVLAFDGARCDVVGVGTNPVDVTDVEAPAEPSAPQLTAHRGAILLEWLPVAAGDLAGYRIYYSNSNFIDGHSAGVRELPYLEGATRHLLSGLSSETFVRIAAVDVSGNESAPSPISSAQPISGVGLTLLTSSSHNSAQLGDVVTLTVTGAAQYDFDTDGDGDYDITGDTSGVAEVDTSASGLLRPAVRGQDESGQSIALGGVSLLVSSNIPPLAVGLASPQSGTAPLDVTFSGTGSDDDGTIVGYAWDFDGDGVFDYSSPDDPDPPLNNYATAGLRNAKFRVEDDYGSFDIDTLAVNVVEPGANQPPIADLSVESQVLYMISSGGSSITADASNSIDPEGGVLEFSFDYTGIGDFTAYSPIAVTAHLYVDTGTQLLTVRVRDDAGLVSEKTLSLSIYGIDRLAVDSGAGLGDALSIREVDGRPAILYWDSAANDLFFTRGRDKRGLRWTAPVRVDGLAIDAGDECSLFWSSGRNPEALYEDSTASNIKYRQASDLDGSAWGAAFSIDSSGKEVTQPSMVLLGGLPSVVYVNTTDGELRFVKATATNGSAWAAPQILDTPGTTDLYPSVVALPSASGTAIAYYDGVGAGALMYVTSTDFQSTSWNAPIILRTGDNIEPSLAIVGGNPAIAYVTSQGFVGYIRSSTARGDLPADWSDPVTLTTDDPVQPELLLHHERPVVIFEQTFHDDIRMFQSLDALGTEWDSSVIVVDGLGNVGSNTRATVFRGNMYAAYQSITESEIRQAYISLE